MTAAELRERLTNRLVSEIDDSRFPSVTMLNRVEATLSEPDELASYAESLVKKIEATRFPSIAMLNRVEGVIARLEQAEQREREARREDE
jgi:hypothetical protein